jgi:hypothetical protein
VTLTGTQAQFQSDGTTPAGSTTVIESDESFDRAFLPGDPAAWETRASPPAVLHMHVKPGP